MRPCGWRRARYNRRLRYHLYHHDAAGDRGLPDDLTGKIDAQVAVVQSPQPRKVSHALETQPFVHSTAQIGNTLRVLLDKDLPEAEQAIRQAVAGQGLQVDACRMVHASLEDVFVAVTQARKRSR